MTCVFRLNRYWAIGTVCVAVGLATWGTLLQGQVTGSLPSDPGRLREMQHHFTDVTLVHEAMIRGNLRAIAEPARRLAAMPTPAGTPREAAPFLVAITLAGRRAAGATTLSTASRATVSLLQQCGGCHVAVGVRPAAPVSDAPDVGGIVGHMLEHQRAANKLLLGLIVPSATLWAEGAEALAAAPLKSDAFNLMPRSGRSVRAVDAELHAVARRAGSSNSPAERANAYAQILTLCASCHGLHPSIWGPGTGR